MKDLKKQITGVSMRLRAIALKSSAYEHKKMLVVRDDIWAEIHILDAITAELEVEESQKLL